MQVYVRDCTMVSVYPLLLFGGGNLTIDLFKSNFVLSLDDGWIRFMVTTKEVSASIIQRNQAVDLGVTIHTPCNGVGIILPM